MEVIVIDIFDLGLRIRNVRKAHNLTQKTLAAKLQLAGYDFNDLAILRISSRVTVQRYA